MKGRKWGPMPQENKGQGKREDVRQEDWSDASRDQGQNKPNNDCHEEEDR